MGEIRVDANYVHSGKCLVDVMEKCTCHVAMISALEQENARLRTALEAAKVECVDACCDSMGGDMATKCTCGANTHNARIDAALATQTSATLRNG